MRSLEEQIGGRCIHFTGISNNACEVGVNYVDVRDSESSPYKWPCTDKGCRVTCDKRRFPTAEEVKAEIDEIKAHTETLMKAMSAARDDAKAKGFKRGNGGRGKVKCPCCESGELHYSVASLNGHLWGKCSTPDCVSWMQ